jgi:hypothetical protein
VFDLSAQPNLVPFRTVLSSGSKATEVLRLAQDWGNKRQPKRTPCHFCSLPAEEKTRLATPLRQRPTPIASTDPAASVERRMKATREDITEIDYTAA